MNPVIFKALCASHGIPEPEAEFRFHAIRLWRFDWAWPHVRLVGASGIRKHDPGVALEIEGGVWTNGRHTRGKGFVGDIEKLNAATLLGWQVLRCVPAQIDDGSIFPLIKELLG